LRWIDTALVACEPAVAFWAGLERIRRVCKLDLCVRPFRSLDELTSAREPGRGRPLVVVDLPSPTFPGRNHRRWNKRLRALLARKPRPAVVLFTPALAAQEIRALSELGVEEFVLRSEEDYPYAVQRVLIRLMLREGVDRFLDVIPRRALSLEEHLTLAGLLIGPDPAPPEQGFADRCGKDLDTLKQQFERAGLPTPSALCAIALLYRLSLKELESEGGGDAELRSLGLGWDDLQARCPGLKGGSARALVHRGMPELVLAEAERLLSAPPSVASAGEGVGPVSRRKWEELYVGHREEMVALSMSLGLAREDAEAEVQDIFTRVKLDHADLGRAYLLRAVANQVKKRRRRAKVRREAAAPPEAPYLAREAANPWSARQEAEARRRLDRIVEALPEPGRTVFRLCFQVGWTAGRVAPLLGMTTKSVERVRERVRTRVRKWLEDIAHGDDGWAPV
jgi:RNA polymerase sigma factor (sigma-70 family)